MEKTIIFVYNADNGIINSVKDYFHKVISPKDYACNLCALTYNALGMKSEWKKAIEKTGMKTEFMHRNEFLKKYKKSFDLPIILIKIGDEMEVLVSAKEIKNSKSLQELIDIINKKIRDIS